MKFLNTQDLDNQQINEQLQSEPESPILRKQKRRFQHKLINVALVSDFYLPFVGGVEMHIKQLAQLLSQHQKIGKVIVITHKYDHHTTNYIGEQNHNGFKVYYLNIHYNRQLMIIYPTFMFGFRQAVRILKKQKIDIVHCHQTGSTLSLQYIFYAKIIGLKVILTQHSLYGFRSISEINFNRACQFFVSLCDRIIAVSQTTRNNLILRAKTQPNKVYVIPNGVSDVSHIKQKRLKKSESMERKIQQKKIIKIITVGRMTYRRGTDLLIEILPQLCKKNEDIQIIIVGDGTKRRALQNIIERYNLHKKVKLLGIISNHDELLELLSQCNIFLNTPLTQSFGIALAEAAMLGLYCVSTNVGGVKQAIPSQYLFLSSVHPSSLIQTLEKVINKIRTQSIKTESKIKFSYPWRGVCQRTIQLYQQVVSEPKKSKKYWLKKILSTGHFFEIFFVILAIILWMVSFLPFF